MLTELRSSHVGFYRRDLKRGSAKAMLAASYTAIPDDGTERWVFQNVHSGGPADVAGLKPGDVLISVDGHPLSSMMKFSLAENADSSLAPDRLPSLRCLYSPRF
jgi:S1-C subfamily serine protease